jgi:AAA domain
MRRHPSRHATRPDNSYSYPLSPSSHTNSVLDSRLEFAQQRVASQLRQLNLAATTAPEITPLDALLSMQMPCPQWVIPEVLPVGITLLTGRAGVGKSWLAFKLALAIANNTPVLGQPPVSHGRVLYLGLEENRHHTFDRATKLLQGQPAPHTLEWADSWHPLCAGGLADIEDWLDTHKTARLVVIDPLNSVYPQHRSNHRFASKERENTIMIPLKVIAAMHDIAILVIHHLRQPNDDTGTIGTIPGYADFTDCTMLLKRVPGTQKATLHITGQHLVLQW